MDIFCHHFRENKMRARSSWGLEQAGDRVVGRSWKERDRWASITGWDWNPGSFDWCTEEFELCFLGKEFHSGLWPVARKIRCGLQERPSLWPFSASETISGFWAILHEGKKKLSWGCWPRSPGLGPVSETLERDGAFCLPLKTGWWSGSLEYSFRYHFTWCITP